MTKVLILSALLLSPSFVSAQDTDAVSSFASSLSSLKNEIASNYHSSTTVSPYYYRLLDPGVYNASAAKNVMTLSDNESSTDYRDQLNHSIDQSLLNLYLQQPSKVKYSNDHLAEEEIVPSESPADEVILSSKVDDILNKELQETPATAIDDSIVDIGLKVDKPNFWTRKGEFSLQFSQNYFSDNWYKGGNNSQNLLSAIILEANYDDTKRIKWENRLELRLGFMTTTSDTCHTFLTSNDKIDLTSKLGIKAKKSWYYTVSAEAKSQFMPGYKTNDRRRYSSFLSPLDVYLSVGMDFKPTLKNGNEFSLALLPISYKMRYLRDHDENIHSVYNMVGKDCTHDIGSKIEMNSKLKLAKDFFWKSRFYYFTAYDYAESEWENSFQYQFSKYISAEVFTLWRFDDNRDRKYYDDNLGYFQFKEYFTLGLTYAF